MPQQTGPHYGSASQGVHDILTDPYSALQHVINLTTGASNGSNHLSAART